MRKTIAWLSISALLTMLAASCGPADKPYSQTGDSLRSESFAPLDSEERPEDSELKRTRADLPVPELSAAWMDAHVEFSFDLYQTLLDQEADKNMLISPLSLAAALSMTYNGAAEGTQAAMKEALRLHNLSVDEVNEAHQSLMAWLASGQHESIDLSIANSLWVREGYQFHPDFLEANTTYYNAEVTTLDFQAENAADQMNAWISENTNHKIKWMIKKPISDETILFLMNAVYFYGSWAHPFNEQQTSPAPFRLADGNEYEVQMMSRYGEYDYLENDSMQMIRIPYGEGDLGMFVILPSSETTLEDLHQQLNASQWREWRRELSRVSGKLQLPRFQLEYETSLNDTLSRMGMEEAFSPLLANFEKMISLDTENAYISNVRQKTYIDVNEKGTEAAAVTVVDVTTTSAPATTFEMKVDRPFFFVIEDQQTSTILFMGSVRQP